LGKYRILQKLGEGGAGNVYLAAARGPGGFSKLVVMKTLKREFLDDATVREMFLSEARLAARLNHPNIVQTNEVIQVEDVPSIVMEYLDGQALSDIVHRAKGTLPLAMHLRIICDAMRGLHYAHELLDYDGAPLGLVHRDVTPHNLFVTFEGQVKLLDFGIAKISTASSRTEIGVLKGKLRYMAPEQFLGEEIDRRADLFAVGIMLWEAMTGQQIWQNESSDVAIIKKVVDGNIPKPTTFAPHGSPEFERICMRALAVEPANRYPTAAQLEADLEAFLGTLDSSVSNPNVGKFVATLFEDARASTKAAVAKALGQVSWDEYRPGDSFTPPPHHQSTVRAETGTIDGRARPLASVWAKGLIVATCLLALTAIVRVSFFKDRDGHSNDVCSPSNNQKACPSLQKCVPTDSPQYGCASPSCDPCDAPNGLTACVNGQCAFVGCQSNFADCDRSAANGCEISLLTDPSHCGSCVTACSIPNALSACVMGACQISSCYPPYENCDGDVANGCETNMAKDPNHCGACSAACTSGQRCANSHCI
jgi:serine/threonine protein kinase